MKLLQRLAPAILLVLFALAAFWWFYVPHKPPMAIHWLFPEKYQLHFLVVGDTGTGDANQLRVARAMEARCVETKGADGILLLGDNFYDALKLDWEKKVFGPYGSPCLKKLPIYAVLGNHDYYWRDPHGQIAMTEKNDRWVMPYRFYSLHFGRLLKIVAFDSNYPDFCGNAAACAIDFLNQSLADEKSDWTVVMAHHPLFSSEETNWHRSLKAAAYRSLILPATCGKIDAYLTGHSHLLEFSTVENCGFDQVISGGGGRNLYPVKKDLGGAVKFAQTTFGFVDMTVDPASIRWKYYSDEGKLLYEAETLKRLKSKQT